MIACPVPGKRKSAELCEAFIRGAGAAGARSDAAVFYGVDAGNDAAWRAALASGRDWYYIDNSYFDATRGTHYRVTRNRLQHPGTGHSDGHRFAQLRIRIRPWRAAGEQVLICPQSEDFMVRLAGQPPGWAHIMADSLADLLPGCRIRTRQWNRDKRAAAATLGDEFDDLWALVTWSSAAAVTAVLAGVPVFSLSHDSAAWQLSGRDLFTEPERAFPSEVERLVWASVLADNQWNIDELRDGTAWRMLNA